MSTQAISTTAFIDSLGVNTHIDFGGAGYGDLQTVISALNYLGLPNVRDSANAGDLASWQQVAAATGVKFDDYLPEGSPAAEQNALNQVSALANAGLLNFVEGGNEEDDSYPVSQGNSLGWTAQFQQQVYNLGHSLGLPVINMSFGAGWTAANNWQGDYGAVGDLSNVADYANAHTYPAGAPNVTILQLNADAHLAAASRPVINTELGYDLNAHNANTVAVYTVEAALDGLKDGDPLTYFYALFDDSAGAFGLMNSDGSARPAGTALHDLTSLLKDSGGGFTPGSLDFSLAGTTANDNSLLMEKSDGSYWLALWNESDGVHNVTLNLASAASSIQVFDPVTGTSSIQSASNTSSISLSVGGDPLLVEISGDGAAAAPAASTPAASTPAASTPAASTAATPAATPASTGASSAAPDPVFAAPATASVAAGGSTAISGVSLSDPWASGHAGTLALNVTAAGGSVTMGDGNGNTLAGSGTGSIQVSGSLAQINAELATLAFTPGSGAASVTMNAFDQAGVQTSDTIGISVGAAAAPASTTPAASTPATTPAASAPAITIDPGDASPVINASNTTIGATAGDHMLFIGGTNDVATLTGGTETVQAYQGGNTITTGAGDDSIRFGGSGNVIDAGGGNNTLADSGTSNTIVLPGAGAGYDTIYGYLMTNGDKFDLRALLGQTSWQGDAASIGNYLSVSSSGNDTIVSVTPAGAGGASSNVADLVGTGQVSLATFLNHAIT